MGGVEDAFWSVGKKKLDEEWNNKAPTTPKPWIPFWLLSSADADIEQQGVDGCFVMVYIVHSPLVERWMSRTGGEEISSVSGSSGNHTYDDEEIAGFVQLSLVCTFATVCLYSHVGTSWIQISKLLTQTGVLWLVCQRLMCAMRWEFRLQSFAQEKDHNAACSSSQNTLTLHLWSVHNVMPYKTNKASY